MRHWLLVVGVGNSELIPIARAAEGAGFSGVAIGDHVAFPTGYRSVHPSGQRPFDDDTPFPDVFTAFAAMAAVTTTLRFVSYAYVLPMREPLAVAKQVATVADLSAGRVALGVGTGWLLEEFAVLGQSAAGRSRRTDEMLDVLHQAWATGHVEHWGTSLQLPPTTIAPRPSFPIPVYAGGTGSAALRRAARHDGWLSPRQPPDRLGPFLEQLRSHRAELGRTEPFAVFGVARSLDDDERSAFEHAGATDVVVPLWGFGSGPTDAAGRLAAIDAARQQLT